jgi:hypothetical protein
VLIAGLTLSGSVSGVVVALVVDVALVGRRVLLGLAGAAEFGEPVPGAGVRAEVLIGVRKLVPTGSAYFLWVVWH